MNLVDQIARMIAPDAFTDMGDWTISDDKGTRPFKFSDLEKSRRNYFQSQARNRAFQILELVKDMTPDEKRAVLVEDEAEGWKKLGLDHPGVRDLVEKKFAGASI